MTTDAICRDDFHRWNARKLWRRTGDNLFDALGNIRDRNDQLGDDDTISWPAAYSLLLDVASNAGVLSKQFDQSNAGNKYVVDNLHVEQRHCHWTIPLLEAKSNPSTLDMSGPRHFCEQRYPDAARSKIPHRSTYPLIAGITRASLGMTIELQPAVRSA